MSAIDYLKKVSEIAQGITVGPNPPPTDKNIDVLLVLDIVQNMIGFMPPETLRQFMIKLDELKLQAERNLLEES